MKTPEEFAKCFYTPGQLALLSENDLRSIYEEIRARDAEVYRVAYQKMIQVILRNLEPPSAVKTKMLKEFAEAVEALSAEAPK